MLAGWVGSWVGSWSAPRHLGLGLGRVMTRKTIGFWLLAAGICMLPRSSQLGSARLTRLVRAGLLVGLGWFVAVSWQ